MADQITYADKNPGDQALSSEANEVKEVVNTNASQLDSVTNSSNSSMLAEGDNDFFIMASGIFRATNSFSNGVAINWEILAPDTFHESSFFTSATGNASNALQVSFPNVKNVLNLQCQADETISRLTASYGSTVSLDNAEIFAFTTRPLEFRLTGNGTTTWVKSGAASNKVTVNTFNTGFGTTTILYGGAIQRDGGNSTVVYQGDNNYRIRRRFSGIGTNDMEFQMYDISTNTEVITAPTSSDQIVISGGAAFTDAINLQNYSIGNNESISGNNLWVNGMFELWMKAITLSDTEVKCIWQSKSGVTTYNLYRDTNSDLSTKSLIYSGALLEFTDTGLTTDTMYYYELEDQTGTEITRFNTKTK